MNKHTGYIGMGLWLNEKSRPSCSAIALIKLSLGKRQQSSQMQQELQQLDAVCKAAWCNVKEADAQANVLEDQVGSGATFVDASP